MRTIYAYLKLFRWQNLIIIILLQYLLRSMVIIPLLNVSEVDDLHFFLFVVATISIAAARYSILAGINEDDAEHRSRSQPAYPVRVSRGQTVGSFWLLSAAAVLISAYVSYEYSFWILLLIMVVVPVVAWVQAVYMRKFILTNHLLLTLLAAAVPLLVWLIELRAFQEVHMTPGRGYFVAAPVVYAYAVFTAMTTLLREILKDMEDYRMDIRVRYKSLPVLFGAGNTRKLSILLAALIMGGVAWAKLVIFGEGMLWLSAYLLVAVMLPFLLVIFMLLGMMGKPDYARIQQLVKLVMITGVLSMAVLNMYFVEGVFS